ncbi:3'(2'),5'-bisphosphate nucleotidase CysQ [Clostridia bacterium]|nr:3'(2'),5'-bisphosphate nucleotidase CysQ [Clostridia bacterium]
MARELDKELKCAIEIALLAGEKVMEIYQTDFKVCYKKDKSPVTLADETADHLISLKLAEYFPDYGILSEENVSNQETYDKKDCFIVDPIDGTREFVKRNGQFGVNIALSREKESVMGVIYIPVNRTIYYASKGNGAFQAQVNKEGALFEVEPIQVSDRLNNLIVTVSHPYIGKNLQKLLQEHESRIGGYHYIGSSIKGCLVASGKADVYYRYGYTNEWDTAAMQAIVEEAGGIVRQMDGSVLRYNRKNHLNEKGFYIVNRKENIWV